MKTIHPRYNSRPEYRMHYASLTFNSKCNAKCQDCCGEIINKPDMPLEKVKEILNVTIQGLRIKKIYPSCLAEMTLIPYVNDIVKYMEEIHTAGMIVSQDTNARFIPDGFIETLNSLTFSYHLSISIWGYDEESWNRLQGEGSFETVVGNIRRYLKELKYPPTFSFPYITDEQYTKTLAFITELCKEVGYQVQTVTTNSDAPEITAIKDSGIIPVYIRKYSQHVTENIVDVFCEQEKIDYVPFNNCDNLFQALTIDSLGNIYPCTGMYRKPFAVLANVNDYSPFTYKDLLDILHSDKAMAYLHDNYTAGRFACDLCKTCSARICN